MIQIARVAKIFQQDPVALLRDSGDHFLLLVRIAAAQVVERDEAKQNEQIKAASRRRR